MTNGIPPQRRQGAPQARAPQIVTDRPVGQQGPFHVHLSDQARAWLNDNNLSLVFTTYTLGKVVMIGPGNAGMLSACERNFGRAMALVPTAKGFYLSTLFQVWRFEHSLPPGVRVNQHWDRLYMPRSCHVTGNVDVHDLHQHADGGLLAAITQYNCIATLDERGNFSPVWRPAFIDKMVGEDRCHLNGFCMENGEIAYVTAVSETNEANRWRDKRADGGVVIDAKTKEIVARGLAMPHTPRLYRDRLWIVEAGKGWFGYIDRASGKFEHVTWCPGFLRGLRFYGKYALLGMSLPRNQIFAGLPLDELLKENSAESECAIYVIDLDRGTVVYRIRITGSVTEIYDMIVLEETRQPMMIGLEGQEVLRFVYLGPDTSS